MCIWVIMDKHDYLFFAFSLCDKSPRSAKVNLFFSLLAEVLSKDNNLEKVHQGYIIKGKARPDLDTCPNLAESSEKIHWTNLSKSDRVQWKNSLYTCPNLTVSSEKIHWTQAWPYNKFQSSDNYPFLSFFYWALSCSFHELVCRVRRVV